MNFIYLVSIALLFIQYGAQYPSDRNLSIDNGGKITGRVLLGGEIPPVPKLDVHKDVDCCGSVTPSPRLSVGKSNGLNNAVVSLENVSGGKRFDLQEIVMLDQKECHFEPHVVILPFGGQLVIRNSDNILHNVRAYHIEEGKTVFNIAQPVEGQQTSIRPALFDRPGIYHAVCDAGHPWMSAFIVVADHPYYTVTGDDGKFTLDHVPPGNYIIRVWHGGIIISATRSSGNEVLQYIYEDPYIISKEITVKPEVTTTVDFILDIQ